MILLKICSDMPRAISFSPIMIRFAPNLSKYSISASEWARAMISSFGLMARAFSMKLQLSNTPADDCHEREEGGQLG